MTFQKIWVRRGRSGVGRTTIEYNPEKDLPTESTTSITPTTKERNGDENTIEMLVVGLIIADNPFQYASKGTGLKDKGKIEARKARGILSRPDKVLRALVPVTDYIASQVKFYVAINLSDGLCDLRIIPFIAVFFFKEFFADMQEGLALVKRKVALVTACKTAAAKKKEIEPGEVPSITVVESSSDSDDGNPMPAKRRRITPKVDLDNRLQLCMNLHRSTRKPQLLITIAQTALDAAVPVPEGVQPFLNEQLEEMTTADTTSMLQALKATYDFLPTISPEITIKARDILQGNGRLSSLSNSRMALPMFLGNLQTRVNTNTNISEVDLTEHVREALESTLLAEKCSLSTSTSISTNQSPPSNDLRLSLQSVRDSLKEVEGYLRPTGEALREHSDDGRDQELNVLAENVCEGAKQLGILGEILGDSL